VTHFGDNEVSSISVILASSGYSWVEWGILQNDREHHPY